VQPKTKEHWILRITPHRCRQRVIRIGFVGGTICTAIIHLAGMIGLYLGPIAFAAWRPRAPISRPVLWLRSISDPDWFMLTYTLAVSIIIGVIFVSASFAEYVRNTRNA
jgi:hypothetical protein